ncbi:hypothetical protein SAMN05660772_02081 [Pasteurella testudinis DSM 23072]|uniref:Uncharacterized protein n=1 Tax=Pasteurella testudinis DSM 23072 TaxID=1122938 RepID=A0A1W1UMP7_9PAST|nr:hypothetical protein [Pasteurella testudinis]SMB82366.1 hypothetical protein SAMN05660772_02081 [Pasteurella testudinis DSM 23072]SUB52233.1 Uncharacterised protein [Pasteurella testudinis]
MKKLIFVLAIALYIPYGFSSSLPNKLAKDFKGLQIAELTIEDDTLWIKLDRNKITVDALKNTINSSFCSSVNQNISDWKKLNIKQVAMTNKFGLQGYIFKGGIEECLDIWKLTSDEVNTKYMNDNYIKML